jgi:hypothetical protein
MNAFWFWLQPVAAVVFLALGVWAWVGTTLESATWVTTFPQVITALFFLPGAALALVVNTIILSRRKGGRSVRLPERIAIGIAVGLVVLTVALGFVDGEAAWAAFITWPLIIVAAIVSTIVIVVGNVRAAKPQTPGYFESTEAVAAPDA